MFWFCACVFRGLSSLCASVPVPEDGFLLGCVFAVADYPEHMSDKQLLATWKRVSRAPGTALCHRLCAAWPRAPSAELTNLRGIVVNASQALL